MGMTVEAVFYTKKKKKSVFFFSRTSAKRGLASRRYQLSLFEKFFLMFPPRKKEKESGDCITVATQSRQLHYSKQFIKEK